MAKDDHIIRVDTSDADRIVAALRAVHTPREMETLMSRACRKTAGRVRRILQEELPRDYHVKKNAISKAVKSPHIQRAPGMAVNCAIPIEGVRHAIGGEFEASGGKYGWKGIVPGKRYKIKAKIVKAGISVLPEEMKTMGGKPPFRNLAARKLNKIAFTRNGDEKGPIQPIYSIAIPQMPANRSEKRVQAEIGDYLSERLVKEHDYMIGRIK